MIASLMMYLRPETAAATDRYWALIREALATRGIEAPASLDNQAEMMTVWTAPDLVLSQTCGMPYRTFLHDRVTLIGTPDFSVEGCPPGHYRSALIVRADDPRTDLRDFAEARFAYNESHSQSGLAAAYAHCMARGFWFTHREQSMSHLRSTQMVQEGTADIAAVDGVSWRLIARYEPYAADLRVLEWTAPTPSHPYIAGPDAPVAETRAAVEEAIANLDPQDRALMGIAGMVDIPREAYLAVENPPADALG